LLSNVFRARRAVLQERFDPVEWLEAVRSERITHAMVVPTMLARIVEVLGADPSLTPLTLQTLTYGGARSPAGLVGRAVARMPAVGFVNAFGLTEASSTVCVLTPADHRAAIASADGPVRRRLDSVGRPVPGVEISIQAARGEMLSAGEVGEICIRGGQVVTDYLGAKADIDADGWLHTSDAGYLDSGGYLFVKGRQDDVIIRGGENIDPAEIEDTVMQHPAVKDAAVVGVPDPEWGEVVGLLAVLNPGHEMDLGSLSSWLRGRLAGYKIPAVFEVIEELPRNDLGKLVRRRAAQYFAKSDSGKPE
jgi:fatty-acyl-CoA synthase